jgi:P-type conjugative transfer protein VirB9
MNARQKVKPLVVALGLLMSALAGVDAQQLPTPVSGDTRLVVFEHDPETSYLLLTKPKAVTVVEFGKDEQIVTVAAGDTANFAMQVNAAKTHVLIKPKWERFATSLTVITSRRTYSFTVRSVPEGDKWHQHARFTYPEVLLLDAQEKAAEAARLVAADARRAEEEDRRHVATGVDPSKLAFDYRIEGDADFRPLQVFDDGRQTFVRLPDSIQELPAVFMISDDGDAVLLNPVIREPYLVITQVMKTFSLKLGKREIKVRRGAPARQVVTREYN